MIPIEPVFPKPAIAAAITPHEFAEKIEDLVWELDVSYWEAICLFAADNGLEDETIAGLIGKNSNLKANIEADVEKLNLLPKVSRIPGL